MNTSTKILFAAGGLLLSSLAPLPALAHTDIGVSIGLGVPVYAAPAPVYYAPPPPRYYAPRPVVVYEQPYYAPVYYGPRVYYRESYYRGGYRPGYWCDERGRYHRY